MRRWGLSALLTLVLGLPLAAQDVAELMKQATLALEAEEFERATRLFEEVCRHDPKLLEAWLQLAQLYADDEQWQPAREALQRALALAPQPFPIELDLARVERHLEDFESARGRLLRLLEQRPDHREARLLQAEVLAAEGQSASALAVYDDLLRGQPDSSEAAIARSRLLAEDDPERALSELGLMLEQDAANPHLRVAQARLHMEEGQWPAAEDLLQATLNTHPDFAQAHLAQAQMWQGRGLDDRAEHSYREGLRWSPHQRQLLKGQHRLTQDHAVTLEPLYTRFRDSADNQGDSLGGRLSFDLDRRNRGWVQFEHRELRHPDLPRQSVESLGLGWRGRLSERWLVQAEAGVTAGEARGGLALTWFPSFEDSLVLTAQRQILVDTAQLAANRVAFDEVGINYRRRLTPHDQFEVGYARGHFSDNNQRHAYQLGYFHEFQSQGPRISLGMAARGLNYERSSRAGYFSPGSFQAIQMLFRLENRHPEDRWIYSLEGGLGQQSGGQLLTSLAASLGYRFDDRFELEASALTSNSALGSAAGFSYNLQTLRMLIRF